VHTQTGSSGTNASGRPGELARHHWSVKVRDIPHLGAMKIPPPSSRPLDFVVVFRIQPQWISQPRASSTLASWGGREPGLPAAAAADGPGSGEARNAIAIVVFTPIMAVVNYFVLPEGIYMPVNIQCQRVLADHWVFFVMAPFFLYPADPGSFLIVPAMEIDWHQFHKGLRGFYAGLSANYFYGSAKGSTAAGLGYRQYNDAYLELAAGWQFLLPANLVINLGAGPLNAGYKVKIDDEGVATSGFSFGFLSSRLSIAIGFQF
jgi:hypothetical protein